MSHVLSVMDPSDPAPTLIMQGGVLADGMTEELLRATHGARRVSPGDSQHDYWNGSVRYRIRNLTLLFR